MSFLVAGVVAGVVAVGVGLYRWFKKDEPEALGPEDTLPSRGGGPYIEPTPSGVNVVGPPPIPPPDSKRDPDAVKLPSPPPAEWAEYHGAQPEHRGDPQNTILAVPGVAKHTDPAFRKAFLDVAERLEVPVDSLASIISSESGFDPTALNPLPAGGIFQLTKQANLPGYTTTEAIIAFAKLPAIEQLPALEAYYQRMPTRKNAHPGRLYMLNFLPKDAGKDRHSFKLGDRDADASTQEGRWRRNVYAKNSHFDRTKKGYFTIDDVYWFAAHAAKNAHGKRIRIDGTFIDGVTGKPTTGPSVGAPVLKQGSSGPAVVAWQQFLTGRAKASGNAALDPKGADGQFGANTRAATMAFQAAEGLQADGVVGPQTYGAAGKYGWKPGGGGPSPSGGGAAGGAVAGGGSSGAAGAAVKTASASGLLLAAVLAGELLEPTWVDVEIPALDLVVTVSADAAQAHVGGKALRLPVSYDEVVQIGRALDTVAPTAELSDAVWQAAPVHIAPVGLYEPGADARLGNLDFVVRHNANVDKTAARELVADVGKDWILHPRLVEKGAVNYGWRQLNGKPLQPVGGTHGPDHQDYSQTLRLYRRAARRLSTGEPLDLLDWIGARDPTIPRRFLDAFRSEP